jgi:sterol desaturase/sphingolipid hydroxylase (fatty acid hydroxylase superfamily)
MRTVLNTVAGWTEVWAIVVAFVVFNCSEYFYHRYVAHRLDKTYHAAHHRGQIDKSRYPAWVVIAGMIAVTMFVSAGTLRGLLMGFLLEVCLFIALHTSLHSEVTLPLRWYARIKQAHIIHHQRPQYNFGVTTTIWDRLFNTTPPPPVEQVYVSFQSDRYTF